MTEVEKYLFDINGYIVVRDVLSEEEVAKANEAIDDHALKEVVLVMGDPRRSDATRRPVRSGLMEQPARGSATLPGDTRETPP